MAHIYNQRASLPDERDLLVVSPNIVAVEALPRRYDLWEHYPEILRWDQGNQGACGPHAVSRLTMKLAIDLGDKFDEAHPDDEADADEDRPSPAFAYYTTRQLMNTTSQDSGVDNRTLFQAHAQYGYVHEATMPYNDSDFTTAPSEDAYKAGSVLEGSTYRKLVPGNGSMRIQLASGNPILGAFNVPDYFEEESVWNPATQALLPPRMVPQFKKYLGGHDVAFTGFDYTLTEYSIPVFYVDNSWGMQWGQPFGAPSGKAGRFAVAAETVASIFTDLWLITKEA